MHNRSVVGLESGITESGKTESGITETGITEKKKFLSSK